jgi:tetratricopeptide (TPR) repeat protein
MHSRSLRCASLKDHGYSGVGAACERSASAPSFHQLILARALTLLFACAVLAPTGAAAAEEPEPEEQVKVALFLLPAEGFGAKLVARVSRVFIKTYRKNPALDVEDADKLFVKFAGEVPETDIKAAKESLRQGLEQVQAGEAGQAIETLEQAVQGLESVLAFIKKKTLARAQLALGVAHGEAGRRRAAMKTFVKLLTWRPHMRFDTKTFNAQYITMFERARQIVKKRKRGSVELTTEPEGAKAYVDGRYMGVTPTVAFGLMVGDHYATFKKPGYIKAAQKVTVSPHIQQRYSQELRQSEKYLLLKQSLAAAKKGLGRAHANAGMKDLQKILYVDQAVFATIGYAGPGRIQVAAYMYDLRSRLRLSHATRTVDRESLEGLADVAQLLYRDVPLDGSIPAPPEAPPPPPEKRRPFYSTWWFWTAIGAGVATAIVVPYFAWPDSDRIPDGYHSARFE